MTQSQHSRREFIRKSIVVAAAGGAAPYFSWSQRSFANNSANDRPQIGCIGVGNEGMYDAKEHAVFGDIVAVCDVDTCHLERAKNDPGIGKGKADVYRDYRKLLEPELSQIF